MRRDRKSVVVAVTSEEEKEKEKDLISFDTRVGVVTANRSIHDGDRHSYIKFFFSPLFFSQPGYFGWINLADARTYFKFQVSSALSLSWDGTLYKCSCFRNSRLVGVPAWFVLAFFLDRHQSMSFSSIFSRRNFSILEWKYDFEWIVKKKMKDDDESGKKKNWIVVVTHRQSSSDNWSWPWLTVTVWPNCENIFLFC